MPNNMKSQAFYLLMVLSISLLAACSSKTKTIDLGETELEIQNDDVYNLTLVQFQSSGMELGKLEMNSFHEVVKTNGTMDVPPENRAEVGSYFGGTVKAFKLLPGEKVKKGQVLFSLENPDYVKIQQDYLEAKAQLTYLKSDYERQKSLAQDEVSSQKKYLKAESDYLVTQVTVESLGKKLTLMNIDPNSLAMDNIRTTIDVFSPLTGYIDNVYISKGTFLNPSTMAVSIVNTDHMHLELNIFEKDLAKVKVGQPIKFRIQNDGNNDYEAAVHLVNKTVESENRTIGVHGHLSDKKPSHAFIPGMYVEADIYTSSSKRKSLPKNALVEVEGKFYALVLQNTSEAGYIFLKRQVETGLSNANEIEILNTAEFEEDTQFLTKGAYDLITE
jgi:cobalt-zinc-cadmium efflux system membrane fusion protein